MSKIATFTIYSQVVSVDCRQETTGLQVGTWAGYPKSFTSSSVLDQVRTKFGPWNPEYGTIRDNTGCPKIVGRKDVTFPKSRFGPYSGFQGPNLVRTWSRTLRTHPRVATTQNTGQYGTSENRWAERCNFSDTIFGFLTKSQKPPKVEDCKMELGLVPGWDWASPKIRWAKRCNFSDQIFV